MLQLNAVRTPGRPSQRPIALPKPAQTMQDNRHDAARMPAISNVSSRTCLTVA